jgi:lipopolysaccharide assembly outer membrane protein LptD (OstA)
MLVSQDPYSLDIDLNSDENPIIEFLDVKEHRLSENGIELEAKASRAQRFEDRDILYDMDALMVENNDIKTLRSDNATLKGDVVYLNGDVLYTGNATTLASEAVEYHQKEGKLIGTTPFRLENGGVVANGKSFVYDTKAGKLEAQGISAVIQTRR